MLDREIFSPQLVQRKHAAPWVCPGFHVDVSPPFTPFRRNLTVPIELETLKSERDRLRDALRETETDVRKVEADLKALRQREIQTKREIEALSTLIEMKEQR